LLVLRRDAARTRSRFDPLGAVLLAVGLGLLTLALSFGTEWGWTAPQLIASLACGVVALVALVFVEHRVPAPTVDFTLLRSRLFASANVSLVLSFLALFAVSYLIAAQLMLKKQEP